MFYTETVENLNKLDLTLTIPENRFKLAKMITYSPYGAGHEVATCIHGFIGLMRKPCSNDDIQDILKPLEFISCKTCKTKYKPIVNFKLYHSVIMHPGIDTSPCWYHIRPHPAHKHTYDRFIITMIINETRPVLTFKPGKTRTFDLFYKIKFLKPGFFAKIDSSNIDPECKLVIQEKHFYDEFFGCDDKQHDYLMHIEITNKSNDVVVVKKHTRIGEITIKPITPLVPPTKSVATSWPAPKALAAARPAPVGLPGFKYNPRDITNLTRR
jgi:hypothetical protein